MEFYSTNRSSSKVGLCQAVMAGIAPDGGLYLPETIPQIPKAFFNNIAEMSVREIAYVVADMMLGRDIDSSKIKQIVYDTFTFDIPLVQLHDSVYSLELFHGPTLAFKDVGARFLARVISHYSGSYPAGVKVLVATSGDSGGAVASGFYGVPGVEVYVLYPHDRLTPFQRGQFNTLGGNVRAIEVNGSFDDCQRLVNDALTDAKLRERVTLTTANSLNICRLLPQMFFFFYAYAQLAARGGTDGGAVISIPVGNLGNLAAAIMAVRMGLPVKKLVAASNANRQVIDYLATGSFSPFTPVHTVAAAMDVACPSNIPRIEALCEGDFSRLSQLVKGSAVSDERILGAMTEVYSKHHYLLDPHGATAYCALLDHLEPGEKGVFLETAHPSKFAGIVGKATGVMFPGHSQRAHKQNNSQVRIPPTEAALRKILLSND